MTEFEHNFDWLVGEIDKAKEKARALFSKSLALPKEAPATDKLVAIDTNNGQELIGIGDGLTLENGELKASGGGGDQLYQHFLTIGVTGTATAVTTTIVSKKSTAYTFSDILTILEQSNYPLTVGGCVIGSTGPVFAQYAILGGPDLYMSITGVTADGASSGAGISDGFIWDNIKAI